MDFSFLPNRDEYKLYQSNVLKENMCKLKLETNEHETIEAILRKKHKALSLQNKPDKVKNRGQIRSFSSDVTLRSTKTLCLVVILLELLLQ